MAAGRLPEPGTEFGPCIDPACGHIDCAQTRQMAENLCKYCLKPVGYETRFYLIADMVDDQPTKTTVHAYCHEEAIEAESPKEG
jgi:hypothetical protein